MIIKKLIKFKIAELLIDTLFQGIYKNFRVGQTDRTKVKKGDKFLKIDFYYGEEVFIHHNCEIIQIHEKAGYVTIKYEYVTDNSKPKQNLVMTSSISSIPINNLRFHKYDTL